MNMSDFKMDAAAHIGLVRLRVSDLQRSLTFYSDVLGFTSEIIEGGREALLSAGGSVLLRLEEHPGAIPRPRRSTGLYHFAVLVPDRATLGRSFVRLMKTGYPMTGAADHLVSEALYLEDPDKNGIEIYRDRPKDEWTFDGPMVRMANEPVDLDSLFRDGSTVGFGGLPPGTTMGHIHLHVRDLEEAEKFYAGVLGFDVMMRWAPSALFVSAGGYHHHIGLNTWAGVGSPPPPEDAAGLMDFEIVVPDVSVVGKRLERNGVVVKDGRFVDPSGNGVRLAPLRFAG